MIDNNLKKSQKTYVYNEDGLVGVFSSIRKAALHSKLTDPTVQVYIKSGKVNKKTGLFFSHKEVTDDELKELFKPKPMPVKRTINYRIKKVGNSEFQVGKTGTASYIPANRKIAIEELRKLIWAKLEKRWLTVPAKLATLERTRFTELLEALA